MSARRFRILAAVCGIVGVVALGVYYSEVLVPIPPASVTADQLTDLVTRYHNAVLLDAWLQAIGSLLTVVFFLAIAYMAGGVGRFAGWMTILAAAVTLAMSLSEGTFSIAIAEATANGHPATALTSFDLTNVFIHVFLIVPAPALFLSVGALLLGSSVLPRVFGDLALALGVAFEILGLAGLFSTTAVAVAVFLLMGQELWVAAAAITLMLRPDEPVVSGRGAA